MKRQRSNAGLWWLSLVVLGHLTITLLHGRAHDGGQVAITRAQSFFVYGVILAGPLLGLAVAFVRTRAGGLIVAAAMAGSLLFGLINHFIIVSPDHVSQVPVPWRAMFAATATLLAASEVVGVAVGLRIGRKQEVWS
jgi:hypothetical protein